MLLKATYTIREVADLTGWDEAKVRRMVESGHIDCERIGRSVVIPLATLQARPAIWESIRLREAHREAP